MRYLDHEDDFDAYLRRRTLLPATRSTRESLEPPASVDELVLKGARQAIQVAPPKPLYRAPRWAFPVGLAATLLLSFSILLNMSITTRRHAAKESAAPIASAARTPSPANAVAPVGPVPEKRAASRTSTAPRASEIPHTIAAPPPSALPESSLMQERHDVTGGLASNAMVARSAAQAASAKSAPGATGAPRDPQTWLDEISALRAQGKTAEADAQLRRFRQAFPDYPLDAPAPAHEPQR